MSNLKKMIKEIAVFLMIIGIIITTYSFSASEETPAINPWEEDKDWTFIHEIPLEPFDLESPAKSYYVYNLTEKKPVAGFNMDQPLPPASLTKIISLGVASREISDWDERVIIPEDVYYEMIKKGSSFAGFLPDEELPLRDVAYGSILTSGGEAINAIARYVNPNDDAFVSLMNRRVKELGLKHTHFVNIEGLDSFGHMASAKDLTEMLAWALEDDFVRQVYTTDYWRTSPSYYHGDGLELGSWALQDLRYRLQGIDALGVKTGTTWDAGFCAMGLIRKDGVEYIITLMGIPYYGEHDTPQVEFFKKLADAI